jgi:ribosomal protein S18 acetylase RimI-like enzyme
MEIIRITEEKIPEFWSVRLKALKESPDAFGRTFEESAARTESEVVEFYRKSLSNPGNIILAALENDAPSENKIIGIVGLNGEDEAKEKHKAFLWGMWVDPDFRGKGIGKALLSEVINYAREVPGLEQINLTVVTTMQEALNLYYSLGFVKYGLAPNALKLGDQYWNEELMLLSLKS